MELFGIGPMELFFILVLALIVLGPKDMVKTGQKLGKFLRDLVRSPAWKSMMSTSRELRELPTRLVRESGLQEEVAEINRMRNQLQFSDIPGKLMQESGIIDAQTELSKLKTETQDTLDEIVQNQPLPVAQPEENPENPENPA